MATGSKKNPPRTLFEIEMAAIKEMGKKSSNIYNKPKKSRTKGRDTTKKKGKTIAGKKPPRKPSKKPRRRSQEAMDNYIAQINSRSTRRPSNEAVENFLKNL